jgi:hypothetical protein
MGSFSVFGNGGSTSLIGNNVNTTYNTDVFSYMTATNRSAILSALTTASDHLPVVADYDIVGIPEPGTIGLLVLGWIGLLRRRHGGSR